MFVFVVAGLALLLLGAALVAGAALVLLGAALVAGAGVGVAGFTLVVLAGLLVALLAGAASPHAIPKALRAKTDESAITFFITNSSLLSSSKNKSNLFLPCTRASARIAPNSKFFGSKRHYRNRETHSQPLKRQKGAFFELFGLIFCKFGK